MADLELIFSLFSKNSFILMLVLRGSLQEHLLILSGTDLAHKNSPKCSDMHICMRNIEGVVYGERLKKLKVLQCPTQMMHVNIRGGELSDVQIFDVCNQ